MNKHPTMTVRKSENVGYGREEPIPEGRVAREPNACFLPLPPTVVLPGGTVVIHAQPQVPFRGTRLVVAPESAEHFDVYDIRVGNSSIVFGSAGGGSGAPATAFPPLPLDVEDMRFMSDLEKLLRVDMPACQISQIISVHVINRSDKPQTFRGMFWGVTVP